MTHTPWQEILGCGGRLEGDLGAHEVLYKVPHVHIFNQRKR